jgi:hypothetical protein
MTNPFTALRYLLVALGVFAVLSGIGRLATPANAASTRAESKLADLESRLQRAEMRISELTSAKKSRRELTAGRSGTTRIRAPFELIGRSGNVVMRVFEDTAGGHLELNDSAGKVVARAYNVQGGGGSFESLGAVGEGFAALGVSSKSKSGFVSLHSADDGQDIRMSAATTATGAYINLLSHDTVKASLNTSDRHGQLVIFNERGKAVVNATTDAAGQGEVAITAENQEVRAFMRSQGADGNTCVVRKGQLHCLEIGIPMGGR